MTEPAGEDFAQILTRLLTERGWTQTDLARRADISVSAVNTLVNRKRGTGPGPNSPTIRAIAGAFGMPERVFLEAAGQKVPGLVSPEAEERFLELFRWLSEEEQRIVEVMLRGLVEDGRRR